VSTTSLNLDDADLFGHTTNLEPARTPTIPEGVRAKKRYTA
jgi:hypothetical protein